MASGPRTPRGILGASGPTGPTGPSPLLTKHELNCAWTGAQVYAIQGLQWTTFLRRYEAGSLKKHHHSRPSSHSLPNSGQQTALFVR